jgi:hypothetical protein
MIGTTIDRTSVKGEVSASADLLLSSAKLLLSEGLSGNLLSSVKQLHASDRVG